MNDLWKNNLKDAGLEHVSESDLNQAIQKLGEDEVSSMVSTFKKARERNKNAKTHAEGRSSNLEYSRAYQALVRSGLCSQIKAKYRAK